MSKLANIQSKYPELFNKTIEIRCGEGWYWLIDNLCEQITKYIEKKNYPHRHINQMMGNIVFKDEEPKNKFGVNIHYIREKFGVLDMYSSGFDDEIWSYVKFAIHLSTKTCEKCGSTKYMGQTHQWIRHLCMECGEKDKNEWTPTKETEKLIRKDKLDKIQENG